MNKYTKTNNMKNNMKGGLETDWIVIIFSFIFIGVGLFYAQHSISGAQERIKMLAPEISYQFPMVFTKTFLNSPITITDEKATELYLDKNKVYLVIDLITKDNQDIINLIEKYKDDYIEKAFKDDIGSQTSIEYYVEFSNENLEESMLLDIVYKKSNNLPNVEEVIKDKNYPFFYKMDSSKDEFVIIYFKKPTTDYSSYENNDFATNEKTGEIDDNVGLGTDYTNTEEVSNKEEKYNTK